MPHPRPESRSAAPAGLLANSSNVAKSFMLKSDTTNDGGAVRLTSGRVEAAVCVS
jgi:hypothetical protein